MQVHLDRSLVVSIVRELSRKAGSSRIEKFGVERNNVVHERACFAKSCQRVLFCNDIVESVIINSSLWQRCGCYCSNIGSRSFETKYYSGKSVFVV